MYPSAHCNSIGSQRPVTRKWRVPPMHITGGSDHAKALCCGSQETPGTGLLVAMKARTGSRNIDIWHRPAVRGPRRSFAILIYVRKT